MHRASDGSDDGWEVWRGCVASIDALKKPVLTGGARGVFDAYAGV